MSIKSTFLHALETGDMRTVSTVLVEAMEADVARSAEQQAHREFLIARRTRLFVAPTKSARVVVPGKRADTVYISTVSFKSGDGFRVSRFSTTLAIRLAQVFSPVAAEGVARDLIAQGYDAHCEEVL